MKTLATLFLALLALTCNAASIKLTWDPNPETDLQGYRVYWGPTSRGYTNLIEAGKTNVATVTNLPAGATIYFAVTAYNTNLLESDYSNEVVRTFSTQPQPPANATGQEEKGKLRVVWHTEPASPPGTALPVGVVSIPTGSYVTGTLAASGWRKSFRAYANEDGEAEARGIQTDSGYPVAMTIKAIVFDPVETSVFEMP